MAELLFSFAVGGLEIEAAENRDRFTFSVASFLEDGSAIVTETDCVTRDDLYAQLQAMLIKLLDAMEAARRAEGGE